MVTGRPSDYSAELVDKICDAIANSEDGIHKICKANTIFPHPATIMRWLAAEENTYFREQYARAKELQADFIVEKCYEIADDGTNDYMTITKGKESYNVEYREVVNRSKLRVDLRRWHVGKLAAKKYGDKLEHSVDPDSIPILPALIVEYRASG